MENSIYSFGKDSYFDWRFWYIWSMVLISGTWILALTLWHSYSAHLNNLKQPRSVTLSKHLFYRTPLDKCFCFLEVIDLAYKIKAYLFSLINTFFAHITALMLVKPILSYFLIWVWMEAKSKALKNNCRELNKSTLWFQ